MANLSVTLVRLCKTPDGWKRYPAAFGKNGRIRPNYIQVGNEQVGYPHGRYQIRYFDGRRTVYENAPEHAGDALIACERKQALLKTKNTATTAGVQIVEEQGRINLAAYADKFVQAATDRGKLEAAELNRRAVDEFLDIVHRTWLDEVVKDDLTKHQRELRTLGRSDRTISNRHERVMSFLRYCGVDKDRLKEWSQQTKPSYEEALPEIYEKEELVAFFSSLSDQYYRVTFETLLKLGMREQEAMHFEWSDISWEARTALVRSKPHYKFKVKDCEQRLLPLPPDLLERLKDWRAQQPALARLVLGTKSDKPNTHLLRTLKRLIKRAGLNCNHCESCLAHEECERWFLHKFRATYATTLLRNGVDIRTVQKLMGHSDLESTLRYLRPAEDAVVQQRVSTIDWI